MAGRDISRVGSDVSVIGYRALIADALTVAEKRVPAGVSIEVIDLAASGRLQSPIQSTVEV